MRYLFIALLFFWQLQGSCQTQNIALNKPIKVSSFEKAAYSGNYLNDGKATTRWSSAFADPQTVTI